jgi:hypothetical protein
MDEIKFEELSKHQQKLLKWLGADQCGRQVAGYGMAKWLSAARALQRRGLADSYRTGSYFVTEKGRATLETAG